MIVVVEQTHGIWYHGTDEKTCPSVRAFLNERLIKHTRTLWENLVHACIGCNHDTLLLPAN